MLGVAVTSFNQDLEMNTMNVFCVSMTYSRKHRTSVSSRLLVMRCLLSFSLKVDLQNVPTNFTNELPGHWSLGWMSPDRR